MKRLYMVGLFLGMVPGFIYCCNENSNVPESTDTSGSLTFSIKWPDADPSRHFSDWSRQVSCDESGVAQVKAILYNAEKERETEGGPWLCADHQGNLNVPAKSDMKLVLFGLDEYGESLFRGEKDEITITAGQNYDAGSIEMNRFQPLLIDSTGECNFIQWNAVPGAETYRVLISDSENLANPVIDEIVSTFHYTATNLISGVPYYTQIYVRDDTGNTGSGSDIRSFAAAAINGFAPLMASPDGEGVQQEQNANVVMADNGNIVMVWEDDRDEDGFYNIFVRGFNADGTERFAETMVNLVADGWQRDPEIAMDADGNFAVAWKDDRDQNGFYNIFVRGFYADGTERFTETMVNLVATGQQLKPAIAMDADGNFAVVWEDDRDKNGFYDIFARGFYADGTERLAEAAVNVAANGQQRNSAIAMDENGNFAVVWEDDRDDNGFYNILARGFNADGTERFAETTVNVTTDGQQQNPAIAMDADGNFAVVWQDDKDKNSIYQIHLRRFNAAGTDPSAVTTVNVVATGQQVNPAIAMDANGNFAVVWEDDRDKDNVYDIFIRGFYADGTERFVETAVNVVATGQQQNPAAAMNEQANFAVVWKDRQNADSTSRIMMRRFTINDTTPVSITN